ncbi:MAG: DUF814 domain-containing protein [Candidatus Cloacimonetes bacterium]|nr:DUF814 domain-containing protein [Candidatus Cloacimonadota bacterium]
MEYQYLENWVIENRRIGRKFSNMLLYKEQIAIFFHREKQYLQINLSDNPFCFFADELILPFRDFSGFQGFNRSLQNAVLDDIMIVNDDRIIKMIFNRIGLDNKINKLNLILELIPAKRNLILTDASDRVIEIWKKGRQNVDQRNQQGHLYQPPESKHINYVIDQDHAIKSEKIQKFPDVNQKLKSDTSINEKLRNLFFDQILPDILQADKEKQQQDIRKQLDKLNRKLIKLSAEADLAGKEILWKQNAELLRSNFPGLRKGMSAIELDNYFVDGFPKVNIKLDPLLDPQKNIEYYVKKYRKAKNGKKIIGEQIEITKKQIEKLEIELDNILQTEPGIQPEQPVKSGKIQQKREFRKIKIGSDWEIMIGRNSSENDELVTKIGKPIDWWFHTRIYRGSHVLLKNYQKKEPPEKLKIFCCRLAAYYSKAKKSVNIPVDYTQIRYIRKPRKSSPGQVTYFKHQTIFVNPLSFREAVSRIKSDEFSV